jgi:uncharacterized membrane protein
VNTQPVLSLRPRRALDIQRVSPRRVIDWLLCGYRMFMAAPAVWAIQTALFVVINITVGLLLLPLAPFIVPALFPLFCAGMVSSADRLSRSEPLKITHLFAGFRSNTTNLVVLGGGYLLGFGMVLLLSLLIGGSTTLLGYLFGKVGAFFGGLLMTGLLFYGLWILLLMTVWFAPALVMLGNVAPLEALILSARACMLNLPAFALLGLILYVLISLAMMPAMLGLLVLMPVIAGAVYASYRDVFGQALVDAGPSEMSPPDAR